MKEGPSVVQSSYEAGRSSAPGGSTLLQPAHNVASDRLAKLLAHQDFDPSTRAKGIFIGEGSLGGADPSISDLRVEIGILNQKIIKKEVLIGNLDIRVSEFEEVNSIKTKQVVALQLNLG